VGAARFLRGLIRRIDPGDLAVVVNTADDDVFHGLHVSPDVDTAVYTLAGLADPVRGWGRRGDTFRCIGALEGLGQPGWFRLGDLDLAMHVARTERLRAGWTLSRATATFARSLGVRATVLPMTNAAVRTWIHTSRGRLPFQEYLVRRGGRDAVRRIEIAGLRGARPAPGVLGAISKARVVILPPSNPLVSIHPILGVPGVRRALRRRSRLAIAISPIVGGRAVRGPLVQMLRGLGRPASATGVATLYRGLADVFVLDERDRKEAGAIRNLGFEVLTLDTVMNTPTAAARLASAVLERVDPGAP